MYTAYSESLFFLLLVQLGKTLQPNEMKRFAELLTTYRQGKDVMAFFSGLQNLYGEARKFLLPGKLHGACTSIATGCV